MKILVVYDSAHGNTEQIARAIGRAFNNPDKVEVSRIGAAVLQKLPGTGLVIAGAPTYGGKPTPAMLEFLDSIPSDNLKGVNVAAFDTRLTNKLVGIFGFASGKIAAHLKNKGGKQISEPTGFFVKGSKGPLKDGELERATQWGKTMAGSLTAVPH
jgi:flavodoxin